jgi:type IV pilus assembly protein PilW
MTLVEILISSALISIVIGSVYLVYLTMQDTFSKGELKADLQQNARVGLAKMTQEMRMAGFDPTGVIPLVTPPPKAAVRAATAGCISFLADVEGKDDTSQITYRLEATTLKRQQQPWKAGAKEFSGGLGAQPLTESVGVLAFTYYDGDNRILVPQKRQTTQACPPNSAAVLTEREILTFEEMRRIRRVAITLTTQGSRPGVTGESFTLTSDVQLRNL